MLKQTSSLKAPPDGTHVILVHKVNELYAALYAAAGHASKRDKLGIFSNIERACSDILECIVTAAFAAPQLKTTYLEQARIKTEVTKHLIRISHAIGCIYDRDYLEFSATLIEISKMINGWMRYCKQKNSM